MNRRRNSKIKYRTGSDGLLEGYNVDTGEVVWVQESDEDKWGLSKAELDEMKKDFENMKRSESMKKVHLEKKGLTATYSDAKANYICEQIANGKSLKEISKSREDIPTPQAITNWVRRKPEFAVMYKEARRAQAYYHADRAIEIAESVRDKDEVPAAKLKVDTHKWAAGVYNPEELSGRSEKEQKGSSGPVTININTGINKEPEASIEADYEVKDDD